MSKTPFSYFLLIFLGFIAGFFLHPKFLPLAPSSNTSESRLGGYKLINPLLFCETDQQSPNPKVINLKTQLTNLISQNYSHLEVSVYYRDLNNGPWFGINETESYSPASLLKVPILIAAYKQAETDSGLLNRKILYTKSLIYPTDPIQSLLAEQTIQVGESYTIEELLYRMIVYSDNASTNLLKEIIGKDQILSVYSGLGITLPGNDFDDFLSTRAYSSVYRILYNASYLDKIQSQKALILLSQTNFDQGLTAQLPKDITVAHKFGDRENDKIIQIHDCGIVYHSRSPYALCVMTRGQDRSLQLSALSAISQVVYDGVSYFSTPVVD